MTWQALQELNLPFFHVSVQLDIDLQNFVGQNFCKTGHTSGHILTRQGLGAKCYSFTSKLSIDRSLCNSVWKIL